MSPTATLEPSSPARAPLATPEPPRRSPRARPRLALGLGPCGVAVLASLLLAAASLLLAAAPSYDPWAWIVWGREVLHLQLVTIGGPTWKPLPVLFTTLFAEFGAAAPVLWLLVARAGGILAVAGAVLLAHRLTRPCGTRVAMAAAALAGAGLVMLPGYLDSVASGESEGLLVAVLLLAVLRRLDGAGRQALALGFAAALIRPETWPLLGLYGIWMWRRDPGARRLIAAVGALVPVLWFGPELWGAHSVLRGVQWAQHPRPGSPALTGCPFCAELTGHAWPLLSASFKLGLAGGLGALLLTRRRLVPRVAVGAIVAVALAWLLEEALLTQVGFSGSDRYLIGPVALLIVAGAVGWGAILGAVASARRYALAATLLAGLVLAAAFVVDRAHLASMATTVERQREGTSLRTDFPAAVRRAGGPGLLLACGAVQTNPSEAPLAAWTLGVPLQATESGSGSVVLRSRSETSSQSLPAKVRGYRRIAAAGDVAVYSRGC